MTCVATTAATVFSHFSVLSHGNQETIILYKKYRKFEIIGLVSPLHFVKKQTPYPNPCSLPPKKKKKKNQPATCSLLSLSRHNIPSHLTKNTAFGFL